MIATDEQNAPVQFNNITDFSDISKAALPHAAAIARRFAARMLVVHVIALESYAHIPLDERDTAVASIRREAESRITKLLASAHFRNVAHRVAIEHGDLLSTLSRLVQQNNIDLVVAATHGRHGLQKLLSGSVAEEMSMLLRCPALLIGPEVAIPAESEIDIKRVLHVTEFRPESRRGMDYAYAIAGAYGAHLYLLHVAEDVWAEPLSTGMSADAFFRLQLVKCGWPQSEAGVAPEFLVEFGLSEELTLDAARTRGIQLIVLNLPWTAHPDLSAHLPGPLAYNVATHAPCPVLTVRSSAEGTRNRRIPGSAAAD